MANTYPPEATRYWITASRLNNAPDINTVTTTTIRQKLIFYFILPIFGMGILFFGGSRYFAQKEFLYILEERAIDDSRSIADHVGDILPLNDRIQLTGTVLEEKYAETYISYITLFDNKGEVLAYSSLSTIPSNIFSDPTDTEITSKYASSAGSTIFIVDRPVFSGLYKIGTVRTGFDFTSTVDELNYLSYLFIGIGILILLIVTGFMIKLSITITQPIIALKEAVAQFSQGNFSDRAHIYSSDEVGDLAKAFNVMADTLKSSKELVENERVSLQGKIDELEKWQEATVGRELKMVELKKKLKSCEEGLSKINNPA